MTHEEAKRTFLEVLSKKKLTGSDLLDFARAMGLYFNQFNRAKGFMKELGLEDGDCRRLKLIARKWVCFMTNWEREDPRFEASKNIAYKLNDIIPFYKEIADEHMFSLGCQGANLSADNYTDEDFSDFACGVISREHPTIIQLISGFLFLYLDRYFDITENLGEDFYWMPMI